MVEMIRESFSEVMFPSRQRMRIKGLLVYGPGCRAGNSHCIYFLSGTLEIIGKTAGSKT